MASVPAVARLTNGLGILKRVSLATNLWRTSRKWRHVTIPVSPLPPLPGFSVFPVCAPLLPSLSMLPGRSERVAYLLTSASQEPRSVTSSSNWCQCFALWNTSWHAFYTIVLVSANYLFFIFSLEQVPLCLWEPRSTELWSYRDFPRITLQTRTSWTLIKGAT